MRKYNGKQIELLAPCGNYKMAKDILDTGCDAIYLGGQDFNMRMHSKLMNFSMEEIGETVQYAHDLDKMVYVTVNSMIDDNQIDELVAYLVKLEQLKVDAIIVQDLAIIKIIEDYKIKLNLHASVMMNIHNENQLRFLEEHNFTRFVSSRELSLDYVSNLCKNSNLELEYFVSGDMCTVHGSLCHSSGVLLNKSANKGQCFKMCRWKYNISYKNKLYVDKYHLAAKDMDLVMNVKELILEGVNSFKIEGRRKPKEEIISIINNFYDAINCFFEGKEFTQTEVDLYPRDTSTAYAFHKPKLDFINDKNEGDPNKLKIFSTGASEVLCDKDMLFEINDKLSEYIKPSELPKKSEIAIKVQSLNQAMISIVAGADIIYLSLEFLSTNLSKRALTVDEINIICREKGNSKIFLALPTMIFSDMEIDIDDMLEAVDGIDGLLVSDIGQVYKYISNYVIHTDFSMNINNKFALEYLSKMGVECSVVSIEATEKQLGEVLNSNYKKQIIVYGNLNVMYLELDLYDNIKDENIIGNYTNNVFDDDVLCLVDNKGNEHPVYVDNYGRNHILTTNKVNMIPLISTLLRLNANVFRVEASTEKPENIEKIISNVRNAIENNVYEIESNGNFVAAIAHIKETAKYVITK